MEHIRIAIRDSTDSMNICFLDNKAGIKFHESTLQRFLKGTCNFLTLKFYGKDIDTIYPGCRLAFKDAGNDYWLTINSFEKNGYECSLTAYSLSLETNKEKRKAFKAPKWTFKQYLDYVDPEHSLTLGLNEVEGQSMQLEWSGTDTILARLFSIANSFGAELEFITELNDDYSLKRHVLNVYKVGNIGKDKTGMPIRVGKSLKVINYTANIDELYTAIRVHGKDGLTIAGLDKKVYDSDKKLLYYTQGDTLYAPQARDRFPAIAHKASDSFICLESEDTEHSTKEALYAYMLGELKKHSEPKIDYETEGYVDGEIGDRMLLIDAVHYDPPLYVEARISEQTISLLDKSKNKTVFTNYERKYSQIDERLLKIMDDLVDEKTPYVADILTSNGSQFVNKIGTTTLTPSVVKGLENATGLKFEWFKDGEKIANTANVEVTANDFDNKAVYKYIAYLNNKKVAEKEITLSNVNDGKKGEQGIQGAKGADGRSLYTWLKYADDANGNGMSETPDGKKYIGLAYNKTVATESSDPSDYTWSLIQGENGVKGEDGKTYYTWVKYADTSTGEGLSDNPTGKKYIGLAYNKTTPTESTDPSDYTWALIKGDKGEQGDTGNGVSSTVVNYGVSTSGTTQPTSWGTSIPSVPSGQFLWTRTVMNYTNGSSTTFFSVAKMGETGARGSMGIAYLQPTAPTGNIETGSTWFKTVSTTDNRITSIYHYLSGSWVQNQFTQDAINVNSLSALSATLGNVTAGTITGSVFTNDFNRSYTSTLNRTGTMTLTDGKLRIDYHNVDTSTGEETATNSYMEYSETGIDFAENDGTATGKRLELNTNRLALGSSSGALYADPTKVQLSGNGYFQMQPKYFLGSSGDTKYQKMSWTAEGFGLRPVDIYGDPRRGNTGIEMAGDNSYIDFKTPYNSGEDYDTRIILHPDKSFQIENVVADKPITLKSYDNLRVFTDNSLIVRSRLDKSWRPVYASSFSQQSDEKWKYDVKDMPSRLEQFKNLDFKAYRLWAEDGKYQEGVIANDNIELPFISKGYDGYSVDTYAYITFIGKATQEYIVQTDNTINELKNENTELKNKVINLESELETIKQQLYNLVK